MNKIWTKSCFTLTADPRINQYICARFLLLNFRFHIRPNNVHRLPTWFRLCLNYCMALGQLLGAVINVKHISLLFLTGFSCSVFFASQNGSHTWHISFRNNLLLQSWPSSCWPAHIMGIYSNPLINGLIQHTFKINLVFWSQIFNHGPPRQARQAKKPSSY